MYVQTSEILTFPEHMKGQRDAVVQSLLEGLKQIQTKLLEKKLGCNFDVAEPCCLGH